MSEDEHGFIERQRENWPYFIEKILELSEREKTELDEFDNHERDFLLDFVSNMQICKHFYNTI